MSRSRFFIRSAFFVGVISAGLLPLPLHAQEDCKATVQAELASKREKDTVTSYAFKVDFTTQEACADIEYVLSTTEQLPDGKTAVVETPGNVRLRQGSTTQKLTYDLKKVNTMVEWKVEQKSCKRCEP